MVSKVTYTDITNKQTNGESGAALVNDTKRAINEVIDLVGDIDLGGVGGSTLPVLQPRQLGDGVKTTFNTPATGTQGAKAQHFDVYLNYVYQRPELDFSIDGATGDLTFLDNALPYAPNLNDTIDIKYVKPYTFDTSSDTPVEGTGTGVTKSLGDWFGEAGPAKVTATGTTTPRSLAEWTSKETLTYNSIVDAKSDAKLDIGQSVKTLGYYSSGDGGGAEYIVVAGGTGTDDVGSYHDMVNGNQLELRQASNLDVRVFGVLADTPNQQLRTQAFMDYCAATNTVGNVGCTVLNDGVLVWPQGLVIDGLGTGAFKNTTITTDGTLGSEVGFTAPSDKGDTLINAPNAGLSVGDEIFIMSCINSLSSDAGEDQLGSIAGSHEYFAEFQRVQSTSASQIALQSPLVFDYSTTAGPNSLSRTNSTFRTAMLHSGGELKNITLIDQAVGQVSALWLRLTKNFTRRNVTYIATADTVRYERVERCLDCISYKTTGRRSGWTGGDSTEGYLATVYGSQNCHWKGVDTVGGRGVIDFTFLVSDPSPSINCTISALTAHAVFQGVNTHPGIFNCGGNDITITDCEVGIRVRSPRCTFRNFNVSRNFVGGGTGVFLEDGYHIGTVIENGTVEGFLYGVNTWLDDRGQATEPSAVRGHCVVSNITGIDCTNTINLSDQDPTAELSNIVFTDITSIRAKTTDVFIGSYNNAVHIDGVKSINPVQTGRAVIEYKLNLVQLSVDNVVCMNAGDVYGLRGPGFNSFITDLVTFPGGDSEGQLDFGDFKFKGILTAGREFVSVRRDLVAFEGRMHSYGVKTELGRTIHKAVPATTGDPSEVQDFSGNNVNSVTQAGRFNGSKPNSVKAAIAASTDIATLKAALDDLFD